MNNMLNINKAKHQLYKDVVIKDLPNEKAEVLDYYLDIIHYDYRDK